MKRHFSWMDKPVTWGTYLKLAGVCGAIATIISAVSCIAIMDPVWWQTTKNFVKRLFKK